MQENGNFRPLYFCVIHRGGATVPYKEQWPSDAAVASHQPKAFIEHWDPLNGDEFTLIEGLGLLRDDFDLTKRELEHFYKQLTYKTVLQLYTYRGLDPQSGVVEHFWELAMPFDGAVTGDGIVGNTARGP